MEVMGIIWCRPCLALCLATVFGCGAVPRENPREVVEASDVVSVVREIPLRGHASNPEAELSGLGWCGESLILLPQYPMKGSDGAEGRLWSIRREQIEDVLDERVESVTPSPVAFRAPEIADAIDGFQGYEAIAFNGRTVAMTIEAGSDEGALGYLVTGEVSEGCDEVRLERSSLRQIPAQRPLPNLAYEALLFHDDELMVFFEVNSARMNPNAVARVFPLLGPSTRATPMVNLEHRLTDVTALDGARRFWAIIYRWAGDRLLLPPGSSAGPVEQLVELQIRGSGTHERIHVTQRAPLSLAAQGQGRNWEGVARLEGRGLVLVTDLHPRTILGFVPFL